MFARMDKVERMGTGISRMRAITKAAGVPEPKFTSNLFFTITFKRPKFSVKNISGSEEVRRKFGEGSEISSEKILKCISKDKYISSKKISEAIGISPRAVEKQIAKLKSLGYLKRIGSPKAGYWGIVTNRTKKNDKNIF
ncbi:MAG: ATP-dependent DNA helicase RecG [uncultured bacterium]|nr:MAG: ATP-dependent DNA helicase RecG [uncultured bacterium]